LEDLLPGTTGYVPARKLEALFSLAIDLERGIGVVVGTTVSFEDQASVSPKKVGSLRSTAEVHRDVHFWLRQASLLA
jgi:hypothetical protein